MHRSIHIAIAALHKSASSSLLGCAITFTAFIAGSMDTQAGAPSANGKLAQAAAQKAPEPIRLLAKLKNPNSINTQAYANSLNNAGLSRKKSYQIVAGLQILEPKIGINKVTDPVSLRAAAKELMATGLYEYVEPDHLVFLQQLPDDARFTDGTLWGLRNNGQNGGRIGIDVNAVPAWDITTGTSDVVVAVIDTGVRYTHQDLAANMWVNEDEIPGNGIDDDNNGYVDDKHGINAMTNSGDPMDDDDHGSHCSGTIAATAFGGGGHVGVAYNVRIMALKFLGPFGGTTGDAITCIEYAIANGADIMSNSWGGGPSSQALLDAIRAANQANIIFIAAAGNAASNNDSVATYPCNYDVENVISVAAIDRAGNIASFSNYGATTVDLGAPGVSIYSTTSASDTSYDNFDGTSMACPHVSGVAALILGRNPGISVTEMRSRLLLGATPITSLSGRTVTGGMVNALNSINMGEDDDLELRVTVDGLLEAGTDNTMHIMVSDLSPVTGATVTGNFQNQIPTTFLDDGNFPDTVANDGTYSARIGVPLPAGFANFTVNASAAGKNPATQTFALTSVSVPTNDDFENRITLAGGTSSTTGGNLFASSQTGEPSNPFGAGGKTVWWSWTAQTSGSATINTSGSNFDTTLAVYVGTELATLSHVASNDDSNGLQSSITFSAIEGQIYAIQIDGYAGEEGTIVLNYPDPGFGSSVPQILRQPVAKSLLVGAEMKLFVSATGSAPLQFQWFQGSQSIPDATSPVLLKTAVAVEDQGFYRVEVTNDFGTITSEPVFVSVNLTGVSPANDHFENAIPLPGSSGTIVGTNTLATGQSGEPNHVGTAEPLESVWYTWQAPTSGVLNLNTFGSDFDTTLAAYTGASASSLTRIASNDDTNGRQSMVSFTVTAGTTYHIAVDGFTDEEGTINLEYEFTPASGSAPPNDMFANRVDITSSVGPVPGSNVQATAEPGEPDHAEASAPIESVWWSWTAPSHGQVTFTTADSDFDTTVAVYTGTAVTTLNLVAFDDDSGPGSTSSTSFEVVPGQTYAISVDGYAGSSGNISISASFIADAGREPNDLFASSTAISSSNTVVSGSNVRAYGETGEPNHLGFASPIQSVWWTWTAPSTGLATFSTEGSNFDTVLAIYTGKDVENLTEISSNDDASDATETSATTFETAAGQTYAIAVDGFGNKTGAIILSVQFTPITVVPPSTDATLSALTMDGYSLNPAFSPSTTAYAVALPYNVSTLRLTPTAADDAASITVNGTAVDSGAASSPITIAVGSNTISIVVTSESGATKTYSIVAARATPSSNANLSALSVSKGTLSPVFSSATTSYSVAVSNSTTSLSITPTTSDAKATVKVNGVNVPSETASSPITLEVGQNVARVAVTAESGYQRTYTITIQRARSSNANLSNLTVSKGNLNPAFSSAVTAYAVAVSNSTDSISITPTTAHASATVKVNGISVSSGTASQPIRLEVGRNVVRVVVTAQNRTERTYTIAIQRALSSNANLAKLSIKGALMEPAFKPRNLYYRATANAKTKEVSISLTPADSSARVWVNGKKWDNSSKSQTVQLNRLKTVISILVKADDGSSKTYRITVRKNI